MTTLFLIRHGLTAQTGTTLYGQTRGIGLDHRGRAQAEQIAARFAAVKLTAIYSSPLERCVETVEPLGREQRLPVVVRDDLIEMDAGSWTGRSLASLRRMKRWGEVQRSPSTFRFPDGESVRRGAGRAPPRASTRSPGGIGAAGWRSPPTATSSGCLMAHYAGAPLDAFQRTVIDTASVSVIMVERGAARVLLVNDTGGLDRFGPPVLLRRGRPPAAKRGGGSKRT